MITLRNTLPSTLLLAALLLSSVAQPMKRTNDGSDNNGREHKRQKVNDEIMITLKSDDHAVEIAKSSAMHSVTLKNMIDDCGPDTDFSEVSFPMPNMSQATLKHVVDCLNIIKKNNPDYHATRAGLVIYVRHLHKDELETLRMAANFLDLDLLIDVLKSAGIELVDIFGAPAKQSVEQKHTIATHTSTGPIKLSWQDAGQDQWIEIPRKLAQHSGMLQEVMSMDSGYSIPVLNASQTTLEHIVACLNIIDDNENQNNRLKFLAENFKNKALSFAHLDSQLWNESFKSMESIKAANKSNLSTELTNYIKDMSHKNVCHLMNAANYLNIVPLMDVCIKKCVEFCSSNQALNDFKEFAFVGGFPELPFDLSNLCAQKLSYFPEIKDWLVKPVTLKGNHYSFKSVWISPNGEVLASGFNGSTINLWEIVDNSWMLIDSFEEDSITFQGACFSSDGTCLAAECFNSTTWKTTRKLWEKVNGKWDCIDAPEELNGCISLCFSQDGKTLASGHDNAIKLWEKVNGKWDCIATLEGHNDCSSVCFSPDGKTLASVYHKTITLWKKNNGKWDCITTLEGHNNSIRSVCFSPDGKTLASGSVDNTITLWNVGTHELINIFTAQKRVVSLSFSLDGKTLISGSLDDTIMFWNIAQMQAIPYFFNYIITLEQAMFLKLVYQTHATGAFDLTKNNQKHLLEIFQTLPETLRELLLEKQFVRIES